MNPVGRLVLCVYCVPLTAHRFETSSHLIISVLFIFTFIAMSVFSTYATRLYPFCIILFLTYTVFGRRELGRREVEAKEIEEKLLISLV